MTYRAGRIGWAYVDWPRVDGHVDGVPVAIELMEHDGDVHATAVIATLQAPLRGHLEVTREGMLTSLLKLFGAQDIAMGDAPFDAAFRVTASSEDLARTLLTPAARAEMLKLSCRWLAYDDGSEHGHAPMVLFEMSGVIEWDDILNRMLALVVTLSQAQAVPPSAYR